MEQTVVFEQKVFLTPKDMNRMAETNLDDILLEHLRDSLENKCSQHGFVISGSLELVSRSMGHLDNGRFTGNVVFYTQVRGEVYNPANGTKLTGTILKKNKMGLYVVYKDAIRVLVARDLHRDNEEFEALQVGDVIQIEIRKSRFQIRDPFILSIGIYLGKTDKPDIVELPTAVATAPQPPKKANSPSAESPNSLPPLEPASPVTAAPAQSTKAPASDDDEEFVPDMEDLD
jgi:DNA-directed RNA polymerase subunit E'/Rpb7